ncbi:MAG TPA: amidohydrolase family protein [Kofleriaceae bacterium]|nr:amidohydrolase family protein [Kofleriaceae bacterium]
MIIDAHMHVGEWDHPDFLGRACDMTDVARVMTECGLDGAAIVPTDRCDNAGLLADMRRVQSEGFGRALWFFPWVRPGGEDLSWVEANLAVVTGLKIHPSLSRVRVSDPEFAPALELAAAHELVVLVHCGRWQEMASYRFAIEAAQRYPRARFLLAHGGGDTPPLSTAAAELVHETGVGNVWFEFSGLREYWVVERNVALLGAERYLMGSDYSLAHPRMYLGAVEGMALDAAAKDLIRGGNAQALFGAPLPVEAA